VDREGLHALVGWVPGGKWANAARGAGGLRGGNGGLAFIAVWCISLWTTSHVNIVPENEPDNAGRALTDAIYRHAFPDSPDPSLLASTRKVAIAERLGQMEAATPQNLSEMRETLKTLGFDRSMLDAVRDKSLAGLGLLMHHAHDVLSGDIELGRGMPAKMASMPERFTRRSGKPAGPKAMPSWGIGFNRALARTDADLAAIDAAILAVTGTEPPRGQSR
jgi:hypothetical protein